MIHFVGAGSGAVDLITVQGAEAFEGSRYSGVCRFTGKSGAS